MSTQKFDQNRTRGCEVSARQVLGILGTSGATKWALTDLETPNFVEDLQMTPSKHPKNLVPLSSPGAELVGGAATAPPQLTT